MHQPCVRPAAEFMSDKDFYTSTGMMLVSVYSQLDRNKIRETQNPEIR